MTTTPEPIALQHDALSYQYLLEGSLRSAKFFLSFSTTENFPLEVLRTRVADGARIADVSLFVYRMHKALLERLPNSMVSKLAAWKLQRVAHTFRWQN